MWTWLVIVACGVVVSGKRMDGSASGVRWISSRSTGSEMLWAASSSSEEILKGVIASGVDINGVNDGFAGEGLRFRNSLVGLM